MNSLFEEVSTTAHVAMLAVPALIFSGLLIVVGAIALQDQQKFGNVWYCLPAGVLMAVLICILGCQAVWIRPRQTIWAFKLNGSTLSFETVTGWHNHSSSEITGISPIRSRTGRLAGWQFDVAGYGLAILPISIPNAALLISALSDPAQRAVEEPTTLAIVEAANSWPKRKPPDLSKDRGLSLE